MNDHVVRELLQRIQQLERATVRLRYGLVTDDAPLTIDLGDSGATVTPASVGAALDVGDQAAMLAVGGDLLALGAPHSGGLFVGQLAASARSTEPPGWLFCAGQSVLRASYPQLFAAISTTYGSADGTHFNLPDLRGRAPFALDNQGGSDAGRLAASNTLGGSGGEETHTLTVAEMPAHDHSPAPTIDVRGGTGETSVTGGSTPLATNQAATTTEAVYIPSEGGGAAHNNMPPYLLVHWLIYAGA